MAKTYTLIPTAMHAGRRSSWSDDDWNNYIGNDSNGLKVGYYSSNYRCTNIMFDATTLASLRSKTVTSIKLKLTFALATTLYSSETVQFPIGYKLNATQTTESSGAAWRRSDEDSISYSKTAVAGYVRSTGSPVNVGAGESYTFDLTGSKVPVYGYVLGTKASNTSANFTISGAQLIIETNETDYTYTLSYNANGGSGAPASQTKTEAATSQPTMVFTLSSTEPTRSGYSFLGWATSASSEEASYQPEGSISISRNTTLYAVWQRISYTVSYKKGAYGSGTNTSDNKNPGVAITLRGAIFTRDGYTQQGWSTSDGGSKSYNLSASYSSDADATLYPYWVAESPVASTIKVYIKLNGEMVELLSTGE